MIEFLPGDRVVLVDQGPGQPPRIEHDVGGAPTSCPRGTVSMVFDGDMQVVDWDPPYRFRNGRWANWGQAETAHD